MKWNTHLSPIYTADATQIEIIEEKYQFIFVHIILRRLYRCVFCIDTCVKMSISLSNFQYIQLQILADVI